jgi:hypothetical protein
VVPGQYLSIISSKRQSKPSKENLSTKLLLYYYFSIKIVCFDYVLTFFLFAGKLTLIQSRAETAEAKQKKEARHHTPSLHISDTAKQKKEKNPKTDEELESTRCRRYSERKRHLSQTTEAETKRPRSSAGRSTEKETPLTAKTVAESIPVTHLDASKYLPRKGSRTTPTSVVCTRAVPASSVTCPSAVHPSPVTCLTAVPLSHPPAVPPSSATVTTAVHPPSVTCTTAVRSTVRQAVVESRSPSKATRSKLCPDSSKDADRLPYKSPAKKADTPSLQRKRPCSGGENNAKENETPVVFDLRTKLRHSSGNRNDPTPRSNIASAKSDLRQVADSELTHTPLVHRVEKSVHLRLGRPPLPCDDAEKETRQKKSPEKCNVPKTLEVPHVPDVLTKNSIQNMLDENRTSHSRKDDQKSTSSLSASVPVLLPLPSEAPAEDLEEGEITDEDVESDEQQLTTLSGTGSDSSRGRELNSNGPELQSQKLQDTKLASDSLVRKNEDVSKRCSRESLSELDPVTHASRKEPNFLMKEKSTDENIVKMKKGGKHLKEGKSKEEEAAKENTNRGRERIELELRLDVAGCGQQEPRVLLKRLKMKELQQVERLEPAKEGRQEKQHPSKESKKAEKPCEKRGQEVQKRLLDKLEEQQVQRRQLVKESGQEEKELQLEKLGTSREEGLQEEKRRQESQERLLKKDKKIEQEVVAEKKDQRNQQEAQELRLKKPDRKSRPELQKALLEKSDENCSQVDKESLLEKQKMTSQVQQKAKKVCDRQERKQSKRDEESQQNKLNDRRSNSKHDKDHQKQLFEKEQGLQGKICQEGIRDNSQKNQMGAHTDKISSDHGNVQIKKAEKIVSQGIQNQLDKKKAGDCLQERKDTERGKEESPRIENRGRKHSLDSFLSKENAADSRKGKLLPSEKALKEAKSRRESVKRQDRDSKEMTSGPVTVLPWHAARPVRSMKDFCDQLVETLFPEPRDGKGSEVSDVGDEAARSGKLKEKHAVGAESVPSLDKEAVMANKADKSNPELNASCTGTPVDVEMVREISKDTREDLRAVKAAVKALEKDKKDAGRDKELAKAAERKKKSSKNPEADRKAFKTAEKAVIVEKKTAKTVADEKVTSKLADMNERADKTAEKSKRVAKTAEESTRAKATEVVMGDSKSEKAIALNMCIPRIGELNKTAPEDATKTLSQDEGEAQTVRIDTKVAKNVEEDRRPSKPAEVEKEAAKGDKKAAGNAKVGSKTGGAAGNCKDATTTMEVEKKVAKAADREVSADSSTTHAKKLMPVRDRGVDDEGRKASAEKQNLKTGDTTFDESEDSSLPHLIDERMDGRIASASGKRARSKRSSGDLEKLKGRTYKYWF